ncbi:MAG: hypothetical protein P1V36_13215 [Planctomycetota bacterium]|nr:hypothetical protein [Planctomycetota bacterium]
MARKPAYVTLAILLFLLGAPTPATAADESQVAEAKAFLATMAADRKAKDRSALQQHLEKLPGIHNGIEDKSTRGKLQKEAGALVKAKGLDKLAIPAVEALGNLNDSKGAYKQLKKHMPGPKDKTPITDVGTAVMGAVAKLAPDGAIGALLSLAEKSRDYDAAALAIGALGAYKGSKKRVDILESLIKLISRFQPPRGQQIGVEAAKRWKALGQPLVMACNAITTRRETTPDAWLGLWKENKKKPAALFNE